MKMTSRCVFHYDKIAQNNFLIDPLIKASKLPNFEIKYLGQFWIRRNENFCVIFLRIKAAFAKYDYRDLGDRIKILIL